MHKVTIPVSCDDNDIFFRDDFRESFVGALYESLAGVGNIEELFRFRISADRPDADAVTSGHDDAVAMLTVHLYCGFSFPFVSGVQCYYKYIGIYASGKYSTSAVFSLNVMATTSK